jgi:outer membrane receptor protein involved in Fe transport
MPGLPPPPAEPPPIVIVAPALADPAANAAYDVETIGPKRLRASPTTQVEQVLLQVPGVQLFRRSDARSGHPTGEGITLRALGGNASSRALLILDGVPQTDPFGGWIVWPAFDLNSLEQVKVIRGGGSVAYGPGALAGTIDLKSRVPSGLAGSIEGGNRNSLDASAVAGSLVGNGRLALFGRYARGDGFIPLTRETRGPIDRPASYEEASARASFAQPLSGDIDAQASVTGFLDRRERGVPFTANRTRGADASLRLVGRGAWQWSALSYAQWRNFRSGFASVNDARTEAHPVALQDAVPSTGLGASAEVRPPVPGVELRIGVDARRTEGETRELYLFIGDTPTRRRVAGGETLTAGLFADASTRNGPLTMSAGARLDRWTIGDGKLREAVIATGAELRDDRFEPRRGWRPTARAAVLLDAGGGLSLRGAAYLGWRIPSLNELFRPFRAGPDATAANALLDPERLAGAEIGARFEQGPFSASLTLFRNRLSDAIANVTLGHGPGIFPGVGFVANGGAYRQRQNIDAINVDGLEASGGWRAGAWWAQAGVSVTAAKVRTTGISAALDGLRPAQTPNTVLTASGGWSDGGREASLGVRRTGAQYEDDLNSLELPAATSVDVFAAWPIARRVQLIARAENILDAQVVAGRDTDGTIERATPRTLWIGFRLSPSDL